MEIKKFTINLSSLSFIKLETSILENIHFTDKKTLNFMILKVLKKKNLNWKKKVLILILFYRKNLRSFMFSLIIDIQWKFEKDLLKNARYGRFLLKQSFSRFTYIIYLLRTPT